MTAVAAAVPSPLDEPIELWPATPPSMAPRPRCIGCRRECTPMGDYELPVCIRCDAQIAYVSVVNLTASTS
jgi:hypothetical protein